MEVIVASVSDAVLSAFFHSVFEKLSTLDFLKFSREKQVLAEIKKWKSLLLTINALLEDAQEKQTINRSVNLWLRGLQDVAFDIEDVVEELGTEVQLRQPMEHTQSSTSTNKVWKFLIPTCFSAISPKIIKFNAKIMSNIEEITARLHDLVALKNALSLKEISGGGPAKVFRRIDTSSLVDSQIFGRGRDKDAIFDLLMDGGEMGGNEVDVISIIGMAGVGKTTLAQLVYNDDRIKTSFELRAWVCVTEEIDVLKVTKTVLRAVDSDAVYAKEDLNLLQLQLKEKLSGRKFFMVLDDIWNEEYEKWDILCKPFLAGASGSKILVTARNKGVAAIMSNRRPYHLNELPTDDCLSLFTWHALRAKNFDGYPNLKVVGEQIARKCKGLPLVAKTLGGLLRTKVDQYEWENILMSNIWDLPKQKSSIIPALRLSYHHLPSYLKRCFSYCAIFPKDYEFDKKELVLLWMAEGFLQQPREKNLMDLGFEYFNELLSRSFFQQSNIDKTQFVMHDLIHDLAQFVSDEICFSMADIDMLEGNKLSTGVDKIRYLSFNREQYDTTKRFEVLRQMKNLRTLTSLPTHMPPWAACCYLSGDILHNLLPRLKYLRVLCLSCYFFNELPYSVGDLKLLRYLNLSRSRIKLLPLSVGSLLNLQTLILHGCRELITLPGVIKNLVRLCVLDLTDTDDLQEMPAQIGNLKNLQVLSKFIVGKGVGPTLSELRGLLHLRGELSILGLEHITDIRDVNADLKRKHGLTELTLQWSSDCLNKADDIHVLDRLIPHKNLEKLSILFYRGKIFPSWLGDPSLNKIVNLELCDCKYCISLPSLGRLPSLKVLSLKGMHSIKEVGFEFYGHSVPPNKPFPSLEILRFKDMLEWTCWSSTKDSGEEFPYLQELMIEDCPKLSGKLPGHLFSLVKLVIKHCPKLEASSVRFPSLHDLRMEGCNEKLLRSILSLNNLTTVGGHMPDLLNLQNGIVQLPQTPKHLVISNCIGLTSIWRKDATLSNITSLKIKGCSEFVSLAGNEQGSHENHKDLRFLNVGGNMWKLSRKMLDLASLEKLQIESCQNLVFFPETGFLSMLKHLKFKNCPALKSLSSGMTMLNCPLEELEIENCPALTCFPFASLPNTLRRLKIQSCKDLKSLPEGLMARDKTSSISRLENLEIIKCPSLVSFPEGDLPSSLKTLKIWYCFKLKPFSERMLQKNASLEFVNIYDWRNMTSLPECLFSLFHLADLEVSRCSALNYFPETGLHLPNLRKFVISNCVNLKSLPDQMRSLTSLQCLIISECHSLPSFPKDGLPPNLLSLEIWDCNNFKQPMSEWNLHFLLNLRELVIVSVLDTVSFPDEKCQLPTTLVSIYISKLQNLRSLTMGLHNLTLLEELEIEQCPKLQHFPKKGLPPKLGKFCVRDCQLLKQHCLKDKGALWPMISQIPCLKIDSTDD